MNVVIDPKKNNNAYKLWTIKKTVCEMLSDRKYFISKNDLNISFENFYKKFISDKIIYTEHDFPEEAIRKKMIFVSESIQNKNNIIIIIFQEKGQKITPEKMEQYYDIIKKMESKNAIIVINKKKKI